MCSSLALSISNRSCSSSIHAPLVIARELTNRQVSVTPSTDQVAGLPTHGVILVEETFDEYIGVEWRQVVECLSGAYKADRQLQLSRDGKDHATFGCAV